MNTIKRHSAGILMLLMLALWLSFFYNLGDAPLFDRDEGAFTEATREMFVRNDFISTYLNEEPRYDKPILIYWFQAISIGLLGISEFAFRLPSAIFAAVWMLSIYGFSKREVDSETGWSAAVIAATSLGIILIGRAAIADALLNLLIALSLFEIYGYFKCSKSSNENGPSPSGRKFIYRAFLWISLGFLTKGPIAILIPLAGSFIFFMSRKDLQRWWKAVLNPVGIGIFFMVSLPWYTVQYVKEGQPFIDGFFFKHNVGRFMSAMEGHGGLFLYYVPVLILITLPYSTLLIRTVTHIRDALKDDLKLFLWIWFLFVLIFFSVSGTKLPHYILHGCTPLFILMAMYREKLHSGFRALLPGFIFFAVLLVLPDIVHLMLHYVKDEYVRATLIQADSVIPFSFRIWMGLALLLLFLARAGQKAPWQRLVAAGFMSAFMVAHIVWPTVLNVQQQPVVQAAQFVKTNHLDVVMWRMDNPSFSVYRGQATPWRKPVEGDVVVTKTRKLKKFDAYELLFKQGGVAVARISRVKTVHKDR